MVAFELLVFRIEISLEDTKTIQSYLIITLIFKQILNTLIIIVVFSKVLYNQYFPPTILSGSAVAVPPNISTSISLNIFGSLQREID